MISDNKGISFVHINTRSIFRELQQIDFLYNGYDFLFCSETWLDNRYKDTMLNISDMKIFRRDRAVDINDYNIRSVGGGVCIYAGKKFKDFAQIYEKGTCVSADCEIITVVITKPNLRLLVLICVYKPPKGKVKGAIDFLEEIISQDYIKEKEIWIMGDFNTDWLKRDNPDTVKLMSFCKNSGLTQYIDTITRPNKKGGSCIDLAFTNCKFVEASGVLDDIISDQYSIYCIKKKPRETKEMCWKTVRDYRKFNGQAFVALLNISDWNNYDTSLDPNVQWLFLKNEVLNVLSVMCPYKRVYTRKYPPLWITPEIYRLIRERKLMLKLYKATGCYEILKLVHDLRNQVNSAVDLAKGHFIRKKLKQNTQNPKKFWQSVNSLIKD